MSAWLAHSRNGEGRTGIAEALPDHLARVAERAATYAQLWRGQALASAAGLLHDLGKYSLAFQRRLQGLERGVDHWSIGAWLALVRYKSPGIPIALAVNGHHIGLQRADQDSLRAMAPERLAAEHPLGLQTPAEPLATLLERFSGDHLVLPETSSLAARRLDRPGAFMLATRMLFSALTDADFLETEAHFEGDLREPRRYRPEAPPLDPGPALQRVLGHIRRVAAESSANQAVVAVRSDLLAACRAAADRDPGLFTLTAPTGSGKTLAMLAFALEHARRNKLRRIITVIPYLSIIEQTVEVYRSALGEPISDGYLLEHHSLAGTRGAAFAQEAGVRDNEEEASRRRRLLSENWDAPVVVTTSVQMLESLFADRPAACRKLHRLAGSVILFDEVQTLPARLAIPTLGALSELSARFRSTVLFSTATQPAFRHLKSYVEEHSASGWAPVEVVESSRRLFERTRRVEVEWPHLDGPTGWGEVATRLREAGTALCIVNLKRHAVDLTNELATVGSREALFHLSTAMCPLHREKTLAEVRRLLGHNEPCILVSTQCVEAGVDVDFPVVLRAFGPLDAIAQAAGRCNRNGRILGRLGRVAVFVPVDDRYPRGGGYAQAAAVTRAMLRERGPAAMDINDPGLFDEYYRRLYDVTQPEALNRALLEAIKARDFPAVAASYRVIDQDVVNVLVSYDPLAFEPLRKQLRETGHLTRGWIERARPHTISLFRSEVEHTPNLEAAPLGKGGLSDEWFMSIRAEDYDPLLGFRPSAQFFL